MSLSLISVGCRAHDLGDCTSSSQTPRCPARSEVSLVANTPCSSGRLKPAGSLWTSERRLPDEHRPGPLLRPPQGAATPGTVELTLCTSPPGVRGLPDHALHTLLTSRAAAVYMIPNAGNLRAPERSPLAGLDAFPQHELKSPNLVAVLQNGRISRPSPPVWGHEPSTKRRCGGTDPDAGRTQDRTALRKSPGRKAVALLAAARWAWASGHFRPGYSLLLERTQARL